MMKKIGLFVTVFLLFAVSASAEIVRQKNVASYIVFPIVKTDGTLISSASGLDSEIDTFADGTAPDGFTDCTNEATEIGSTGQYYLSLAQAEMNADYIIVQIKSTSTDAIVQTILIRTMVGDPLLIATTDDGGTINVTSGKIDEVATLTGNTAQTGDSYAIVNSGTYGNSAIKTLIDAVPTVTEIQAEMEENGASLLDTIADKLPTNYIMGSSVQTAKDDEIDDILTDTGTTIPSAISGLNNPSSADIVTAMQAVASDFKADVSGLSTFDSTTDQVSADVVKIQGYTLAGTGTQVGAGFEYFFDVASPAKTLNDCGVAGTGLSAEDVWTYATRALTDKAGFALSSTQTFDMTGNITGNLSGSVGSVTGAVGSVTGAVGSVTGAVGSVTAGVTVTTNNDKTGYTVSTVSDKTGYSLSQSFPTNFASLAITAGGAVTAGTVSDKTGYSLSEAGIDAIWDEVQSGHSTAGSFGLYLDSKVSEAGGGALTAEDIWNYDCSGYSTAGLAGTYLKTASSAGDPWATDITSGYTGQAGEYIRDVYQATNGVKDGGEYNGVEKLIRSNR